MKNVYFILDYLQLLYSKHPKRFKSAFSQNMFTLFKFLVNNLRKRCFSLVAGNITQKLYQLKMQLLV